MHNAKYIEPSLENSSVILENTENLSISSVTG